MKPLIAKEDLVVYKEFFAYGYQLITPFFKMETDYGKLMTASGDMPILPEDYSENRVSEGVIHSYIEVGRKDINRKLLVRSVIKKGTPFFVSFDGSEIASRELLIGNEPADRSNPKAIMGELRKTRKTIYKWLYDENVGKNGIHVGDVLLTDMTFITPGEVNRKNRENAIGIVGFIRKDGTPHVISLKQKNMAWFEKLTLKTTNAIKTYSEAVNDFNGKEHTDKLLENFNGKLDGLSSLEYCLKYKTEGTNEGDWFLPSAGEMLQTVRNMFVINMTAAKLGKYADKLIFANGYWSSTEYDNICTWMCSTEGANIYEATLKNHTWYVRPSLGIKTTTN